MTEKLLGKINFAEFGTIHDMPFLFGLQLGFSMSGCGIMDGGSGCVNIGPTCKWSSPDARSLAIAVMVDRTHGILKDAKVNYVSELVGRPVEVTIVDNTFKDFRILTEVL